MTIELDWSLCQITIWIMTSVRLKVLNLTLRNLKYTIFVNWSIITKIKLKFSLFLFVKTGKLITKCIDKSFQQYISIDKDCKSLYDLCLIVLKAKQMLYLFI